MTDGPTNGDFVRITNREVWERLATVQAKVDDVRSTLAVLERSVDEMSDNHGKRIRALELRFYGVLAGLVGAVVVLVRLGTSL